MSDLFDANLKDNQDKNAPLPYRMAPHDPAKVDLQHDNDVATSRRASMSAGLLTLSL